MLEALARNFPEIFQVILMADPAALRGVSRELRRITDTMVERAARGFYVRQFARLPLDITSGPYGLGISTKNMEHLTRYLPAILARVISGGCKFRLRSGARARWHLVIYKDSIKRSWADESLWGFPGRPWVLTLQTSRLGESSVYSLATVYTERGTVTFDHIFDKIERLLRIIGAYRIWTNPQLRFTSQPPNNILMPGEEPCKWNPRKKCWVFSEYFRMQLRGDNAAECLAKLSKRDLWTSGLFTCADLEYTFRMLSYAEAGALNLPS